jgi:hypothetical protein
MSQDTRYKVYSPNFARIEELGARGMTLGLIKDAFKYGTINSFASHGSYLTTVQNLSFNDKGPDDSAEDSSYGYDRHHCHIGACGFPPRILVT